jgi:hypothetical protein
MTKRTLELSHEEVAMVINAVQKLAYQALDQYNLTKELERFDLSKRDTKENQYALELYKVYDELASKIANGSKDV